MNTFTATPKDVENAFATVFPHVGKDDHLPMLTVVSVELGATAMTLAGTDRYSLAVYRADLEEWTPKGEEAPALAPLGVHVFASDLKRLFAFGRASRKEHARWTFTADRLAVEFAGGESLSIRTVHGVIFPDVRKILLGCRSRPDTFAPLMNVHPEQVEKFIRSTRAVRACGPESKAPMHLWSSQAPTKPLLITVGKHFAGMLMPCRVDEPTLDLEQFLAAPPTAPALPAAGAE